MFHGSKGNKITCNVTATSTHECHDDENVEVCEECDLRQANHEPINRE